MPKFRKKPVVIEARQVGEDYDSDLEIMRWCCGQLTPERANEPFGAPIEDEHLFVIPTLEGEMKVNPMDWVIKGVKGEFYPCKPDIFAATYEPVEE